MSVLLEAALEYRARGWSVFPINPKAKRPMVKWAEYQNRLPTVDEIQSWWRERPNANIGIVTGKISNLVVVDIDPAKGASAEEFYESYPTDLAVSTGGGGYHLYYSYPRKADIRNSAGEDGIDIRANGGYVVGPGSIHASGRTYDWLESARNGAARPGHPPTRFLNQRAQETPKLAGGPGWVNKLWQGVKKGQRDDACSRLAGYFLNKMPPDLVTEMLITWNTRNEHPDSEAKDERYTDTDIRRVVESIHGKMERNKRNKSSIITLGDSESEDTLGLTDNNSFLAEYGDTSVEWLIEDWLPDNTIAMVTAPPGSYKTWLELDLMMSIAGGKPFLNQFAVNRTGPVIIFQQEDWVGSLAERFITIMTSRYDLKPIDDINSDIFRFVGPPHFPIYWHKNQQFRFDDEEAMDKLLEHVHRIRPALVLVDPLYMAGNVEDYMSGTIKEMNPLKIMRTEYGVVSMLLHHTKKIMEKIIQLANTKKQQQQQQSKLIPMNREDSWGSTFLNAFIETGWQIRREDIPNTIQLMRHFKVKGETPRARIHFDINTGDKKEKIPKKYSAIVTSLSETEDQEPGILATIDAYGPMTKSELANVMNIHRSTAGRMVNALVKAGELQKGPGEKFYATGEL